MENQGTAMTRETVELVKALKAVTANIENIASALLIGRMTPAEQRQFAGLLRELAGLLDEHADDQTVGIVPSRANESDA